MKKLLIVCSMLLMTYINAMSDECTKDEIKLGLPECITPQNKPQKILNSDITLCKHDELVLVSSQIYQIKEKLFSLCSDKNNKYLEYRFGTTEHIEFNYRASSEQGEKRFYRGTYIGGNNQTTMFWFYNGKFLYRIEVPFTGISEINVLKSKNKIVNFKCTNNAEKEHMNIKHPMIIDKSANEMFEIWNL